MNKEDMEKLIAVRKNMNKSGYDFVNIWLKVGISKKEAEYIFDRFKAVEADLIYLYEILPNNYKELFFNFLDLYNSNE
jgi:hypothetical protein